MTEHDEMVAEIERLRAEIVRHDSVMTDILRAKAAMRPVVEAAVAWAKAASDWDDGTALTIEPVNRAEDGLLSAVAAYRAAQEQK